MQWSQLTRRVHFHIYCLSRERTPYFIDKYMLNNLYYDTVNIMTLLIVYCFDDIVDESFRQFFRKGGRRVHILPQFHGISYITSDIGWVFY